MATGAATIVTLFPYEPGSTFVIKTHTPPPPFGPGYKNTDPVRIPIRGLVPYDSENQVVDHMDFVISNPPLDPVPTADTGAQPSRALTILETVSRKPKDEGGGPVVVRCYLGSDKSTLRIAKIYDGFEYALAEPGKKNPDCMYLADRDYSREAAAYEAMPARFQGSIVPRYFGSWAFPLPTGVHGRRRWVRMVLLEDVLGECLLDTILHARGGSRRNPTPDVWMNDPLSYNYSLLPPEQERLDILARIIEAESDLHWFAGVVQGDPEPRNVIISRSKPFNAVSRITLIDFNISYVLSRCEAGRQKMAETGYGEGLPPSIIERNWFTTRFAHLGEYREWIPKSWVESGSGSHLLVSKWLIDRWMRSPKCRPPSEDFFNSPTHQYMNANMRSLVEEMRSLVAKDLRTT